MHDPSGCNSTYNTHDEIRWYDQDSLIFISGLTEIDAVMGNDEKFLSDIKEAVNAGVYAIGVIEGSSLMGYSEEEYQLLSPDEKMMAITKTKQIYVDNGANAVIMNLNELPELIEKLETE